MKRTSKIISIMLTVVMSMGLITSVSYASQKLPTTFGWSNENAGYITIDVPDFDGDEVEYFLDLYKDGNPVRVDFGVYFDESGRFESEVFVDEINELGNGVYKYKIGFERDFDTDILINATDFSGEYVVSSYSHSVEVEPIVIPTPSNPPVVTPAPVDEQPSKNTEPAPKTEDNSSKTIIKGRVTYANKYQEKSGDASVNKGQAKPLASASVHLYKKGGLGNSRSLTQTATDTNGNFELAYKQGNYDLIISYDGANVTTNIDVANDSIDVGTINFEPYDYKTSANALILPSDAKAIEITNDNLSEYFEDIKVLGEDEILSGNVNMVKACERNVYCGIVLPYEMAYADIRDMSDAYGEFDEENGLWLIAPNNAIEFIRMSQGPSKQINGIYDEKNNVLYHSTLIAGNGYVFSHFGKNGVVSITKCEQVGLTKYKTTHMTARFKKVPYVTVSYNGEFISFDQKPIIEAGRTLVPLRAIFEKIGANVEWDGDTKTVTAQKDDISISLTIDNTTAYKNGQAITLDVPAKVINGRTLVPVRFVADCFGVDVQWDGNLQKVILTK